MKCKLRFGEELSIEEATIKDAEHIINYIKIVAAETPFLSFDAEEFNTSVEEEENIIQQHAIAPNQLMIVARIKEQIVGLLNIQASSKKRLKHSGEFGISVSKEHWNKGIGKHMMHYLLNWAKENTIIKKIKLRTSENNIAAIKLYEKLGFQHEGEITKDFFVDGVYYNTIVMGMWIE